MNKPVAWNFALSKQFEESIKPRAKKLADTIKNKNKRRIEVTFINYGLEFQIPANYHDCEELEPLERCEDCYAEYVDGRQQFEEDNYREGL